MRNTAIALRSALKQELDQPQSIREAMKTFARVACCISFALVFLASNGWAQNYPTKPIRFVLGFAPGGTADVLTRTIASQLSDRLGQPVVVENRPGVGGNLGADAVAKAPADGYTILMGAVSSHAINPTLYGKMPYDAVKDFAPVTLVASAPAVLVVPSSLSINSMAELIAAIKSSREQVTFGSSGIGSTQHLAGELLNSTAGVKMVHVPYKGITGAIADLLAERIFLMFSPIPSILPHVKEGRLKALAITSASRSPLLPDVPTVAEVGFPRLEFGAWNGVFVPAGTPEPIVNVLNREINQIIATPETREKLTALGFVSTGSSPSQFATMIRDETEKWAKVIRESGARAE